MSTVIKVENVSKLYSLKDVGVATIKSDLKRTWAKLRGKEDPAFLLAEANDRTSKGTSDFVWALKDINFEVKQGEVLGILGKNGAGKSTLLKILSRVAAPTTGQIKMKGRLASLLEVGTGFHPDLSGRENIFLNGSILGMTRAEIKKNFDEIVDFSGIERYIDTPVKRYSSGMYVRLAFAVSAYLESEILIVDEVLSVGDAEFQKKCLGKMKDVSGQGRTILFVSHNSTAIKSLCNTAILMESGEIKEMGTPENLINNYMTRDKTIKMEKSWNSEVEMPGNDLIKIHSARIKKPNEVEALTVNTPFNIEIEFDLKKDEGSFFTGIHFNTLQDECAFVTANDPKKRSKGRYKMICSVNSELLNNKTYTLIVYFVRNGSDVMYLAEELLTFEIMDKVRPKGTYLGDYAGNVRPQLKWEIEKISN